MSPSVICYPTPGKAKSRKLLEAFAHGAGGRLVPEGAAQLEPGAAAFYGVVEATRPLWLQAKREQRAWYYLDNAYFDAARGTHFRASRNVVQEAELLSPAIERLAALGIAPQPWRRGGRHVLVCLQSDWFMRGVCGWAGGVDGWQAEVTETLAEHTDRPIVVRHWMRDKAARARTLREDLKNAWALVTHTSAAANEALLAGIPVFVTGLCAAMPMASGGLERIERPWYPEGRPEWAAGLAGAQWTIDELRDGTAWRALHGQA